MVEKLVLEGDLVKIYVLIVFDHNVVHSNQHVPPVMAQ